MGDDKGGRYDFSHSELEEDEPANDSTDKPERSKLRIALSGLLALVLLVGASVGVNYQLGAFDEPTPEELRSTVFNDGEFNGLDLEGDMNAYTRRVRVDVHRFWTVEELKKVVISRVPNYDEASEEDKVKFEESLDEELANLPKNEDGHVSQNDLPQQFRINPATAIGVLVDDNVVVPGRVFAVLNASGEVAERVTVTVTMLANPDVEDEWKKEELFRGTAAELATEFVDNPNMNLDTDHGLAFLARPDQKVLADPGESPYEIAPAKDIKGLNTLVYPRLVNGLKTVDSGTVANVLAQRGFVLLNGHFSGADMGTPVFLVRDGELVWAGILVSNMDGTGVIVSSEIVHKKLP